MATIVFKDGKIYVDGIEYVKKEEPKQDNKPKWEDFGEIKGYYIFSECSIFKHQSNYTNEGNKNTWPTEEEAEACLALSQLVQWRNKYNEGWVPDWNSDDLKSRIVFRLNIPLIFNSRYGSSVLYFKSFEIANKFLEDFRDLIKTAKPLL